MNEANQLNQQSGLSGQQFATAITPLPGDYDVSTKVNAASLGSANQQYPADSGEYAKIAAKHEAEREVEKTKLVRAAALDFALRCSHPGSVPGEVIRMAREFEAYLTGADKAARLP